MSCFTPSHPLRASPGPSLTTLPWECSLYSGPTLLGLHFNHHHPGLAPLWLLPVLPGPVPSTIPSALCPSGTPPSFLATTLSHTSPRDPPLTDHAPRSFWSAGGSPCWTHCGPACRWDPERCLLDSPCTRTSLGKAQMGEWVWVLIPSSLALTSPFPTGCCFSTWN